MDDVDAVQAQIARNMLDSGDWVTARLDGVKYLEKAPLWYWLIAVCFRLLGVHDWVARIPVFVSAIGLCWLACRIAKWAVSARAGLYAGLVLSTSIGLFLFTRILIPDVALTLFVTLSLWAFLRALEPDELRPRMWAMIFAISIAIGILLKGLIAGVFPVGVAATYLLFTGQWHKRETWTRLHIPSGVLAALAIAAPWHVLATLQNPPWFVPTMHSGPGEYKGFFWFYFVNEHVLRFLNLRYPRDYNTVPRLWFWLLHLVWFFPWSAFLFSRFRFSFRPNDRAGRLRLLCVLWIGFVLAFFSLSTTQEYYSMPCYPAIALLLGLVLADPEHVHTWTFRIIAVICGMCALTAFALLVACWNLPTVGDISHALTQNTSAYTLSLGHMGDLTIASFAYLRVPLFLAAVAFVVGALGASAMRGVKALGSLAVMMILLLHAARLAMVTFDPYLSSHALATALANNPPGQVILDDQYYTFSSVVFYTNRSVLLLNGRVNNLEYGSNAPDAPHVFISDSDLRRIWNGSSRSYLLAESPAVSRLAGVVGPNKLHVRGESGGKFLLTNLP